MSESQGMEPTIELALVTDEEIEAVRALEAVADLLPKTRADVYQWKWVVITLHNALQGYMVLALQGTWPVQVLPNRQTKKLLKAAADGDFAFVTDDHHMDNLPGLYEKIKAPKRMSSFMDSKSFTPYGTCDESVARLCTLRNGFIHFLPKIRRIYVGDLPRMVTDCVGIIEFLVRESQTITWHLNSNHERQSEVLIEVVRSEAARLQAANNAVEPATPGLHA